MCTFFSATYHTISCHSYAVYEKFLALDVASVSLAIYAIFISGIYYRDETILLLPVHDLLHQGDTNVLILQPFFG